MSKRNNIHIMHEMLFFRPMFGTPLVAAAKTATCAAFNDTAHCHLDPPRGRSRQRQVGEGQFDDAAFNSLHDRCISTSYTRETTGASTTLCMKIPKFWPCSQVVHAEKAHPPGPFAAPASRRGWVQLGVPKWNNCGRLSNSAYRDFGSSHVKWLRCRCHWLELQGPH